VVICRPASLPNWPWLLLLLSAASYLSLTCLQLPWLTPASPFAQALRGTLKAAARQLSLSAQVVGIIQGIR
jgi:hypothetical protein